MNTKGRARHDEGEVCGLRACRVYGPDMLLLEEAATLFGLLSGLDS